jgi:DNA-binding Lrp family transcriptional regulator
MVELDLKDRKILYQLDLNCRQSNAQIGKKVGLSRKVVEYRIKRMEEEGVITGYWTAINTYLLGYYVFRIYIKFIDIGSSIKDEIIKYFCDEKDVWAVITSKGPVDLDVIYWVKDIYRFNKRWDETLQKFGIYFSNYIFSILTDTISCKKSYLIFEDNEKDRILYRTNCKAQPIKIDEIDYRLLDFIALNARSPIIKIAEKLDCSSQTIQYRFKHLVKAGLIQAFRISIENKKLGFNKCGIDIFLKEYTMKNSFSKNV